MKMRVAAVLVLAWAAMTGMARAQEKFPEASVIEKDLAARASDVTEVTLSKQMLSFAAQFMDKDDKDDAQTRKLIEGLEGIYVRDYTFEKEGEVTPEIVEKLRAHYATGEWTPMVHERETKTHETSDVMMKMVNGEPRGIFVLTAEPKELTIVLILGPIRMEDLGKLHGIHGLGSLDVVSKGVKASQGK
ncbi:DUF4252 domain-containing protein [Terracidiphilus sp.]|jgi:hypothetical protein|uniref:DUF4252 domain-containing protein n=1 Tax=Terracidiphilus sp. TaxID=1964191 RepID=UPI003C1C29F9